MRSFFRVMIFIVPLLLYVGIIYFRPVLNVGEYETAVAMREWLPKIFCSHFLTRIPALLIVALGTLFFWFIARKIGLKYPNQAAACYLLLLSVLFVGSMTISWILPIGMIFMGVFGIYLEWLWEKFSAQSDFLLYRKILLAMALVLIFLALSSCVITLLMGYGIVREWWWFSKSLIPALLIPGFWLLLARGELDVELKFLELEVALAFLLLTGVVAAAPILRAKWAYPEKAIENVVSQLDKSSLKVAADEEYYALMRWITKLPVIKFSQDVKPFYGEDLLVAKYSGKEDILPGVPKVVWKFGSMKLLLFPKSGAKR